MSKYIAAILLGDIARIAILPGNDRSLAQVKGEADYILNGGFYDMTTGKPVGHLKVGGTVLSREAWTAWGYAWDTGPDLAMKQLPADSANYLSGVSLLTPWDGLGAKLTYPAEVGGYRPRTAIALAGDKLLLYCADSPATPEELRKELYDLGADTALMLDSGGSSQCDFAGERISSSRRVHNYIAVWLKKKEGPNMGKYTVTTNAGLRIRKGPGTQYDRVGVYPKGAVLTVLEVSGGWGRTDRGWVSMDYLAPQTSGTGGKKVVLDPGHGVETAGKRSPDGTYLEHEFNLDMAQRVKAQLERHGVSVTLTRTTQHDVTIQERADVSNAVGPDLFVSLHSNASGDGKDWTSPDGYGIYTSARGEETEHNKAARSILTRAKEAGVKLWGGGLFHDGDDGKKDIAILWRTAAPALLIEHGFHTNRAETEKLKTAEYRALLAAVDAKGILDYLGIAWADEPVTAPETPKDSALVCPHCGGALKIEKA